MPSVPTVRLRGRARSRVAIIGLAVAALALALAGCAHSGRAATTQHGTYQLHMDFFSHETGLGTVIDPQVFVASPGAPAGVGPQMIPHHADIAPAPKNAPSQTPLVSADTTPLNIALGQWEKAAGRVAVACAKNVTSANSSLTGLVPNAVYSVFVVHLKTAGPGRFTPFGDDSGTDNTFTASASGAATTANHVNGCLDNQQAIVVIWHSDHMSHGPTPGTLGLTWHNSLIIPVP